jgi:hypothetical protein
MCCIIVFHLYNSVQNLIFDPGNANILKTNSRQSNEFKK